MITLLPNHKTINCIFLHHCTDFYSKSQLFTLSKEKNKMHIEEEAGQTLHKKIYFLIQKDRGKSCEENKFSKQLFLFCEQVKERFNL